MFYSSDAAGLRKFLKDKLNFKARDIGGGWLIFDLPEADMGCHPAEKGVRGATTGTHNISFYCDDIQKTVEELKAKGVKFKGKIETFSYGHVAWFQVPGGFYLQLYQPRYKK